MLAMIENREENLREVLDQYPAEPNKNDTDTTSTWPVLDGVYRDGGAEAVLRTGTSLLESLTRCDIHAHVH